MLYKATERLRTFPVVMVKRWWKIISLLLLMGCESPHIATDEVLRIGLFAPYASLDPIYARDQVSVWLVQQLFQGLVTYDSAMHIIPAAAKGWEVSADGRVYRFFLRQELTYVKHLDRHLRADDVVYSWHRLASPRLASPGGYLFRGIIAGWEDYQKGKAPAIWGIRALNDSTLEVELEKPYAPFLHLLTLPYAAIVLPEAAESLGRDFGKAPVGLGPFYLLYEEKDRLLIFKRDSGMPKKLMFRWFSNRLWAWEALKNGEIDAFEGTDRALEHLIGRDQSWGGEIRRISTAQLGTEYLGMNMRPNSPFADRRVRCALRTVISRLLLKQALGLDCTPAYSFIPPMLLSGSLRRASLDTFSDAILRLRSEKITLYAPPAFRELCEYIQTALAQEGISIRVEYLLGPSLRERLARGDIHLWKASWLADFPEGENFLVLFESSQHAPRGPNTTHFSSSEMDSLITLARRTIADSTRRRLYAQAEAILARECPVIPLYHAHGVWFLRKGVRNFPISPLSVWLPLERVRFYSDDSKED
ncbi:MAG: ABC transporter substrate-binding protein [Bacteroidia bacterium]|nr:ABC transporter substrate-binding protein [Bacteroidia bacterium]